MKRFYFTLLMGSLFSLNFSSCDQFPSQGQSEIRKAYVAIKNQNLDALKKLLKGKALAEFRTQEGMERLHALLGDKIPQIGESFVQDRPQYSEPNWPLTCFYSAYVYADSSTLLKIQSACTLGYARPNPARDSTRPEADCSREFILDQRNQINRETCFIVEIEI